MANYRAVMIFFLLFSAGLALYIGSQGMGIFRASKNYTARIGQAPLNCVDYFYDVKNINYDGYTLQFDIKNTALTGKEIKTLVIKGAEERSIEFVDFLPEMERHVSVSNIDVVDKFSVYPEGCDVYAKEFAVER